MSWLTVAKSRKSAPPLPKKYIPTSTKKRTNSTNRYKALSEREMRNQTADDSLWGDMAEEKDEFLNKTKNKNKKQKTKNKKNSKVKK